MSEGVVAVTIPAGLAPGMQFMIQSPSGAQVMTTVPQGFGPGMIMHVKVPTEPPVPMVMATEPAPPTTEEKPQVFEAAHPAPPDNYAKTTMADAADPSELRAFTACCCFITSCYLVFPKCISGYMKGVVMCCEVESLCCQPGQRDGTICLCHRGEAECIRPYTCCKFSQQVLCLDTRCAFPCDGEVPCMITMYGLTCVQDYKCEPGCCKTLAKPADAEAGGSPMLSRP